MVRETRMHPEVDYYPIVNDRDADYTPRQREPFLLPNKEFLLRVWKIGD